MTAPPDDITEAELIPKHRWRSGINDTAWLDEITQVERDANFVDSVREVSIGESSFSFRSAK